MIQLGFLGLLYLGHLHRPFHTWADNPLLFKVQMRLLGLITWVIKIQKISPGSSNSSFAPSPSFLHLFLSIASILRRQTLANALLWDFQSISVTSLPLSLESSLFQKFYSSNAGKMAMEWVFLRGLPQNPFFSLKENKDFLLLLKSSRDEKNISRDGPYKLPNKKKELSSNLGKKIHVETVLA